MFSSSYSYPEGAGFFKEAYDPCRQLEEQNVMNDKFTMDFDVLGQDTIREIDVMDIIHSIPGANMQHEAIADSSGLMEINPAFMSPSPFIKVP